MSVKPPPMSMNTALWEQVEAVFSEAVELPTEARGAFLGRACAESAEVRREVEALLAADVAGFALEVEDRLLRGGEEPDGLVGCLVGPYRVEGEVGRGGMGAVYRARRADGAFDKEVALKLVKRGMDTDEVLARFRRERQVLAGLDHPGIARLLDGGAAADGRPYIAMEYVEGEPITAYCDAHCLPVEDRLALFEAACEAVLHAHRRLVVHRDLKPSNILVGEDAHGTRRVRLLDFGIARLLESEADEALTQTGLRRLTPAYAAPEQLRGEAATTATDVYALGVVLYELLAGQRPAGRGEAPVKPPSAAVTPDAVAARGTTVERLRRRLHGDLDTICQAALRDDPEARYPSVESLLDDLRRHREALPLQARPASMGYHARKFVGRHRAGVVVGAGVAVLVFTFSLLYARGIEQEKRVAQAEAERARLVAGVMQDLLETADPFTLGTQRGDSLLLARGREKVEHDLAGEPDLQVDLLTTLGRLYRERGQYAQARSLLQQALSIARATHPGPHARVIEALRQTGGLYSDLGAYADSRRTYREMLAMQQALYGDHAPSVFVSLSLLAQIEALAGHAAEAEWMHRDIVALSRRMHEPTAPTHINSVWKLARVLYVRGKYAEAETALQEVLRLRRARFGEEHRDVAHALQWLGLILTDKGDFSASEAYLRRALAMQRRLLGDEHGDVVVSLFGLGLLASERGDYAEAVALVEESVEMSRRVLGEEHRDTAFRMQILGELYRLEGDYDRALAVLDMVVDVQRRTLSEAHASVCVALAYRARVLGDAGERTAAVADVREALSILEGDGPPYGRSYQEARVGYGELLTDTGRAGQAEPMLRTAVRALTARTAVRHDRTALRAQAALGHCLAVQGRPEEAAAVLREVLDIYTEHYGPENPRTQRAREALLDL